MSEQDDVKSIFERTAQQALQAPPFLATRVLANLEERRRMSRKLLLWKSLAGVMAGALLAVVLLVNPSSKDLVYEANVGQPTAVEVTVKPAHQVEIVRAEVYLPEGVQFYSERHPEISAKRSLNLAWSNAKGAELPFIIKSNEPSVKQVKVLFFDKENRIAQEKIMTIRFMGHG